MRKKVFSTIIVVINLALLLIADKYFGIWGLFAMAIFVSIFYKKVQEKL